MQVEKMRRPRRDRKAAQGGWLREIWSYLTWHFVQNVRKYEFTFFFTSRRILQGIEATNKSNLKIHEADTSEEKVLPSKRLLTVEKTTLFKFLPAYKASNLLYQAPRHICRKKTKTVHKRKVNWNAREQPTSKFTKLGINIPIPYRHHLSAQCLQAF